jgi:hypothetical protein
MYTSVFDTWFLGRPGIFDFWGLGSSGVSENPSKFFLGGLRLPAFGMVFGAAGAAQKNRFVIHGFLADRKSLIFEVWAAPASRKTFPKVGGLRPPAFGMVFGAAGPPRPQISTMSGLPKKRVLQTLLV